MDSKFWNMFNTKSLNQKKMKLLALHGHHQNAAKFHSQTGGLQKRLKKIGVELIFVDGPYIIPDSDGMRSWCQNNELSESYQTIQKAHEENPDVVGIFAFSMGAMLALNLAAHAANHADSPYSWIKLIIAIAAPYPTEGYDRLVEYFPCNSTIPVLFVTGLGDEIARPESQEKYRPYFSNKTIFEHDGGHYIPSSAALAKNYIDFLEAHKC